MLGDAIRKLREDKDLTQEELADLCGVTRVAISRYETGTRQPSGKLLAVIAKALDSSVREIRELSHTTPEHLPVTFTSESLGSAIRNARENAGLTQKDIAAALGVSHITVSRYESGNRRPSSKALNIIARRINVSEDDLRNEALRIDARLMSTEVAAYVDTHQSMNRWRNLISRDTEIDSELKFFLMALPVFTDSNAWIVSVTIDTFAETTHIDRDQVAARWPEVIASEYVERIGAAEWALRLKFPTNSTV